MSRYPHATQLDGPIAKAGYPGLTVNAANGVVLHSAVGSLLSCLNMLAGRSRVSWHFTIAKDGRVYQHYDTSAVCWHAGSGVANARFLGIEHEGGGPGNYAEPLTLCQRFASVGLVRWLAKEHGFIMARHDTMLEHNELYPTECPSGRIPWPWYTPLDA